MSDELRTPEPGVLESLYRARDSLHDAISRLKELEEVVMSRITPEANMHYIRGWNAAMAFVEQWLSMAYGGRCFEDDVQGEYNADVADDDAECGDAGQQGQSVRKRKA